MSLEARLHISRQYRLHVEQHLQALKTTLTPEAERERAIMRDTQAVWNLADLIFVSTAAGTPLADAFATWTNTCFPCACCSAHLRGAWAAGRRPD